MALKTIGRYDVVRRLGGGGMGDVYLANDAVLDRQVAIKVLRADLADAMFGERFAREARATSQLNHPNIVTVFDSGESDGMAYIVMEFIPGETLAQIVQRRALLPLQTKLHWLEQLCSGLAYAHEAGTTHRDIKPANLALDHRGTLKILDFGIANLETTAITVAGDQLGTPRYMSPEQIRGERIDSRSDLFAVGAVAYELLTYELAFDGPSVVSILHKVLSDQPVPIQRVATDVPDALAAIVNRALQKNPDDRFATAGEILHALHRVREVLGPPVDGFPEDPEGLRDAPARMSRRPLELTNTVVTTSASASGAAQADSTIFREVSQETLASIVSDAPQPDADATVWLPPPPDVVGATNSEPLMPAVRLVVTRSGDSRFAGRTYDITKTPFTIAVGRNVRFR